MQCHNAPRFDEPAWIMGFARSGTSCLRRLANSLDRVNLVFESDIIRQAVRRWDPQTVTLDWESFSSFLAHLKEADLGSSPVSNTHLFKRSPDFYRELFEETRESKDLRGVIRSLYLPDSGPKDVVWGDKSADVDQLRAVLDLFPKTRLIFILRDPRAAIASLREHSGVNFVTPCLLWNQMAAIAEELKLLYGESQVKVLKYEELVTDPLGTLKGLAALLDRELPQDLTIVESISPRSLEKWRSTLAEREVKAIEELCFSRMRRLRYAPEVATRSASPGVLSLVSNVFQHALALRTNRNRTWASLMHPSKVWKYFGLYRSYSGNR